jgi:hypothetical protein
MHYRSGERVHQIAMAANLHSASLSYKINAFRKLYQILVLSLLFILKNVQVYAQLTWRYLFVLSSKYIF